MTNEEAISALEMSLSLMLFDPMTGETYEVEQLNRDNQDLYHATELALSALRAQQEKEKNEPLTNHIGDVTEMVPLTLDELRKMDGEPVYVLDTDEMGFSGWGLVDVGAGKIHDVTGCYWSIDDIFDEGFKVYRHKPKEDKS